MKTLLLVILLFGWDERGHDLREHMAEYTQMEVWDCEQVQDVYYLRLDYFDLLTEIEESERPYISPSLALDLMWCSIYEMSLFERLNEE